MSAFEKLPREIRDLIYERCLIYDGEIVPFPRGYERIGPDRPPRLENGHGSRQKDGLGPLLGYPNVKRNAKQIENKPCVALLGINSTIREEVAMILFGKNVWRLSLVSYVQRDRCRLWQTYAHYFRHIVTRFDACYVDETEHLDIEMGGMTRDEQDAEDSEDSDHFDPAGSLDTHKQDMDLLRDDFITKRGILQQMSLKSLSMDFSRLYCRHGCCRHKALESCLECLGSAGPWYMSERKRDRGVKTESETSVKVLGLKDVKEMSLFREFWGFKVD